MPRAARRAISTIASARYASRGSRSPFASRCLEQLVDDGVERHVDIGEVFGGRLQMEVMEAVGRRVPTAPTLPSQPSMPPLGVRIGVRDHLGAFVTELAERQPGGIVDELVLGRRIGRRRTRDRLHLRGRERTRPSRARSCRQPAELLVPSR